MGDRNGFGGHFVGALICFVLSSVMALLLLVATFTVWLSEMMNSLFWAMLLVGTFFLSVAVVVYYLAIREAFRQVGARLDTIYDVAHAVQWAYRKVDGWIDHLLR